MGMMIGLVNYNFFYLKKEKYSRFFEYESKNCIRCQMLQDGDRLWELTFGQCSLVGGERPRVSHPLLIKPKPIKQEFVFELWRGSGIGCHHHNRNRGRDNQEQNQSIWQDYWLVTDRFESRSCCCRAIIKNENDC